MFQFGFSIKISNSLIFVSVQGSEVQGSEVQGFSFFLNLYELTQNLEPMNP